MRVIAGEFRSRVLKTLPGLDTRPTPDRLRETLFNIIAAEVYGVVFLDAYAGTGAVGIEALSRGGMPLNFYRALARGGWCDSGESNRLRTDQPRRGPTRQSPAVPIAANGWDRFPQIPPTTMRRSIAKR